MMLSRTGLPVAPPMALQERLRNGTPQDPMAASSKPSGASRPPSIAAVADALCARIHAGKLVPGQRLVEADLVAELGTTRSRLRDAFRRLEGDGLIHIEPNKGASVRRISREEIVQTVEVMQAISLLIVEKAIERRDQPPARAILEVALAHERSFRSAMGTIRAARRLMDENARFWDALDSIHGNPVASETRRRLEATMFRLVLDGFDATDPGRWVAYHEDILQAVLDGDAKGAARLVRAYVKDVLAAMLELPGEAFTHRR